jgi:hypothetical protein
VRAESRQAHAPRAASVSIDAPTRENQPPVRIDTAAALPPITVSSTPLSRPARDDRAPRGRDDRPREDRPQRPTRAAHRDLAEWSPPAEADDERPILARGAAPVAAIPKVAAPISPAAPSTEAEAEAEATIFVNVGRRDGVQPGDLIQAIADRAQIDPASIGRVRMRDRNAFVDVAPAQVAHIVETLKGAVLGGRVVNAEPARPRSEGGAASAEGSNPTGGEAR